MREPFSPSPQPPPAGGGGDVCLTPTLTLRPLDADEATILAAKLAEMEPWRGLGSTVSGLERYLTRDDCALTRHAILHQGVLSGVMTVREPWLRGAYLELFALCDGCQGQGLGQAIIGWLAARTTRTAPNLWVTVSASNDRARRFYARQGFVPVGDLPDLVRDGCTEILLRLSPRDRT